MVIVFYTPTFVFMNMRKQIDKKSKLIHLFEYLNNEQLPVDNSIESVFDVPEPAAQIVPTAYDTVPKPELPENSRPITKKEVRHLKAGDVLSGSGAKILANPQAGLKTPPGKLEVYVEYAGGKKKMQLWNKYTVVGVKDAPVVDATPTDSPALQEDDSQTEILFKPKFGFWDVTKYPYGGKFDRFSGTEKGKLVKGTVDKGDEIRVQLEDGRTIVVPAAAVANMDFDQVLDLAKASGRELVETLKEFAVKNSKEIGTYFNTQSEALDAAFDAVRAKGLEPMIPESMWAEHVPYGQTQRYDFELERDGMPVKRRLLHVILYRMDSGKYELTSYVA